MKIKIFITTYKNENFLKDNLLSLLDSDLVNFEHEINIINNYTEKFELQEFCDLNKIKVYHNYLRPDFSTGYLSRNWNQSIINGFQDLRNPKCDILVLAQNDNIFQKNWASYIIKMHEKYDFICIGSGDQYHSYLKEHIIKVGLWDERFCNIGFQEYDYFIRSIMYNKDKTTINDYSHKRIINKIENNIILIDDKLIGAKRNDPIHLQSSQYHQISQKILLAKWLEGFHAAKGLEWEKVITAINKKEWPQASFLPNNIMYPYFEKDIDLNNKNYII